MLTPFIYPILNTTQKGTLKLFSDWKVIGKEKVPTMGPLLVVANHQSNIDASLLCASLPRRMHFLVKHTIFQGPGANWFLQSYGAFPLNRFGPDPRAYRWALGQLGNGNALVVFPEGTRSKGSLKRGLPGVIRLALKSQAPLLPVGITGTAHIGSWKRVFNPTGRIRVNVGTVFTLPPVEGRISTEVAQSMTDMIMQRIAALLPESYRGVYKLGPENRPTAATTDSS